MSKHLAASFAQMLGIAPKRKGSKAEDDEQKDKDAKGAKAEDDDKKDDESAKGSRAEDDDGDDKKGAKSEDDDGSTDAKGAKADDEEDDDAASDDTAEDDDGDDKKDAKSKKAAKAERERCARILAHGFKCGQAKQAAVFAFDTGMSSAAAIAALNASGAVAERGPKASSLRDRMSSEPEPKRVEGKQSAGASSAAERILAAGKKRRGEQ
ncbi:TPA: hypothetical protein QDA90_000741 [Burkholderia vietnamiensis]|uniref:hypothetical protein n=2 Tax=Burkholderia contaminans TaxID=488447 RepID=UPI000CFF7DB6|nr:hypothetical protein [Burkholderia contaminans]PRG14373.1 hypothetical protein C6Q17_08885 [Burkholderia contaminans]HDR9065486.1 hypothetical protein [Burkholderia vietnamiensis]